MEQFRDGRGVLWSSVREEIRTALGLVWLCGSYIRFDPILRTLAPQGVKAVRPFGAGFLTQYADWLLEAASNNSSWLRTSSVKSAATAQPPGQVHGRCGPVF